LEVDFVHKNGCTATSFEGSKNNFRFYFYRPKFYQSCKYREVGSADVEIIGVTEIMKNIFKTTAKHKPSSHVLRAERVG